MLSDRSSKFRKFSPLIIVIFTSTEGSPLLSGRWSPLSPNSSVSIVYHLYSTVTQSRISQITLSISLHTGLTVVLFTWTKWISYIEKEEALVNSADTVMISVYAYRLVRLSPSKRAVDYNFVFLIKKNRIWNLKLHSTSHLLSWYPEVTKTPPVRRQVIRMVVTTRWTFGWRYMSACHLIFFFAIFIVVLFYFFFFILLLGLKTSYHIGQAVERALNRQWGWKKWKQFRNMLSLKLLN